MEPFRCRSCFQSIPLQKLNRPGFVHCDHCGGRGAYWLFPAFYSGLQPGKLAPSRTEGQASCFFHPEKVASVACDACGRFLCSLCDVTLGKSHLCTHCLKSKDKVSGASRLENERILHDSITLTLALAVPVFFWPATVVTAPWALYRSIRYFRTPSSLVIQGRWRLYVSMLASASEVILMLVGTFYLVSRMG